MPIYTIYKATSPSGKYYIGFDSKWPSRKRGHKYVANKEGHRSRHLRLYQAIIKHGFENFTWEVLYQSDDRNHTLNVMEPYYISLHDSTNKLRGYNHSHGGEGYFGYKPSPEQIVRQTGRNNGRYNHTLYTFVHTDGRQIVSTQNDFLHTSGMDCRFVSHLVNKKQKSKDGWRVLFDDGFYEGKSKFKDFPLSLYHPTNGVFKGMRSEFIKLYPNVTEKCNGNFHRMITGDVKVKAVLGWKIMEHIRSISPLNPKSTNQSTSLL